MVLFFGFLKVKNKTAKHKRSLLEKKFVDTFSNLISRLFSELTWSQPPSTKYLQNSFVSCFITWSFSSLGYFVKFLLQITSCYFKRESGLSLRSARTIISFKLHWFRSSFFQILQGTLDNSISFPTWYANYDHIFQISSKRFLKASLIECDLPSTDDILRSNWRNPSQKLTHTGWCKTLGVNFKIGIYFPNVLKLLSHSKIRVVHNYYRSWPNSTIFFLTKNT